MSREEKEGLQGLIATGDLEAVAAQARQRPRLVFRMIGLIYQLEVEMGMKAAVALGAAVAAVAGERPELGREVLRRLLWALNDESGGNARYAPQAIGEIIARQPDLYGEYAGMLAQSLDEAWLKDGVEWALKRIAGVRPELVAGI